MAACSSSDRDIAPIEVLGDIRSIVRCNSSKNGAPAPASCPEADPCTDGSALKLTPGAGGKNSDDALIQFKILSAPGSIPAIVEGALGGPGKPPSGGAPGAPGGPGGPTPPGPPAGRLFGNNSASNLSMETLTCSICVSVKRLEDSNQANIFERLNKAAFNDAELSNALSFA